MSGLVLVTGASGKTGGSLVAQLQRADVPYRAASRQSVAPFDWDKPATWEAALKDVTSVYLVAPATVSDPYALMIDFIKLAMHKGVRRFVFLSMASLPAGGPAHGQVHQWLIDNAEDWAVLCPTAFMQNFSAGANLKTIREEDQIYSNTEMGRVAFIDVSDIAAVALAALISPTPLNKELVITGSVAMSYDEVAEHISKACGRRIAHTHVTTDDMVQLYIQRGVPETTAGFLAFAYAMVAAGTEDQVTGMVQTLVGRAPTTFEVFAKANADVWRRAEAL